MPIFTENSIAGLARLVKIGLGGGEAAKLAASLSAAAGDWDLVKAAPVECFPLWTQPAWPDPCREDAVGRSFSPEEATALSGRTDAGLFLVPEIL